MNAIDWIDLPSDTKGRTVLLDKRVGIPGVHLFGCHNTTKAIAALEPHFHRNCFEFTYIIKGNASFAAGGQIYNLSGGDLFLSQMNEVHHTNDKPLPLHKMYWFQLDGSDNDSFLYLRCEEAARLIGKLSALCMHVITMAETEAHSLLESIFGLLTSSAPNRHREAAALLVLFLYRVLDSADRTTFRLTPDIGRAVNYALDHITEELTMDTLARVSLLSVSRFKQKFKTQIGMTPREFINSEKIRSAKVMLLDGMNITETAMELGFSSSNYFSVVFKQFTSFSPATYVKNSRKHP